MLWLLGNLIFFMWKIGQTRLLLLRYVIFAVDDHFLELPTHLHKDHVFMYCLMSSILFWNSALTEFMFVIIVPMFPTIDANIRILARKSAEVFLLWY